MKQKRSALIKAYVTADEADSIVHSSELAGLSVSEFVRRVCLGVRIESREDAKARLELLKVNSDLGRLGGLLKQGIVFGRKDDIYRLLHDIDHIKNMLKEKVRAL